MSPVHPPSTRDPVQRSPIDVLMDSPPPSSPRPRRRSWLSALYPAVWRWHFWAGLVVTPFLLVVSLTGALYVFADELQVWTQPEIHNVELPADAARRPYAELAAAAQSSISTDWEFSSYNQNASPHRADVIVFERELPPDHDHAGDNEEAHHEHEHRFVYVNPYTAEVLGQQTLERSFFGLVLDLHRTLLAGSFGRYLVEIATCWGIVSLLSGFLLWWPRGKEKLRGVWIPRLRQGGKFALRDLHTIPGVYLSGVALAIMGTGLLYTQIWGNAAFAGLYFGGQLPASYVSPPTSSPLAPGTAPASLDQLLAEARTHYSFPEFQLAAPHTADGCWTLFGPTDTGDLQDGVVYLDASTGQTLDIIHFADLGLGAKSALMFYSIHTGSIFGLPTKILAVIACLVIATMSITGVWMWWRRRPAGKFGAPRRARREEVPPTIVATIIVLAVFLPTVGLTLLALALFAGLSRLTRRLKTSPTHP